MSTLFSSVYRNYYEKLKPFSTTNSNSLQDKVASLDTSSKKLTNQLGLSSWKEKGKSELVTNIVPEINGKVNTLSNNIINNLVKVSDMSKKELFPLLQELKTKDDEYDKLQDEIKMNKENGINTSSQEYRLSNLYNDMKNLISKIDNKIIEIKSYNKVDSFKNNKSSLLVSKTNSNNVNGIISRLNKNRRSGRSGYSSSLLKLFGNKLRTGGLGRASVVTSSGSIISNLIKIKKNNGSSTNKVDPRLSNNNNISHWTSLGENWVVVNTEMSPAQYESYAITKGIREDSNPAKYGDHCLAFSYVHASNLYNGYTGDNAESAYNWAHANEFVDFFSDSKQETLSAIYEQVISGKPVILQVNGNSQGTSRHFVTVVGFKDSVKSSSTIQESDLLIMDSWDGKLERMDQEYSRFMTTGAETHKSYSGYYLRIIK